MSSGREASLARRRALSAGRTALAGSSGEQAGRPSAPATVLPLRRDADGAASVPAPEAAPPPTLEGRDASVARRRQLSAGNAAIRAVRPASPDAPQPPPPAAPPSPSVETRSPARGEGRAASLDRRRQLSAGKAALGEALSGSSGRPTGVDAASGREASILRRRQLSAGKAALDGDGAPALAPVIVRTPPAPSPSGAAAYPPKVVPSSTVGGLSVTGPRIGSGGQLTGFSRGTDLPVTGSQYATDEGAGIAPVKVGLARTPGGNTVSGTLVRGQVAITGDHRGDRLVVTGEADQSAADDVTPRRDGPAAGSQFARRAEPHGHSAAGGFRLGDAGAARSAPPAAFEATRGGLPVTGSAVGRSERVTGDEEGSDRTITGSQYNKPAHYDVDAGDRVDPVTRSKVVAARTWSGQVVTGPAIEMSRLVTGSEAGTALVLTGTPYAGPMTLVASRGDAAAADAAARLAARPSAAMPTGDLPLDGGGVTGTGRGAARAISGTPYYRDGERGPAVAPAAASVYGAFSVTSVQRQAHLRSAAPADGALASERITGSFASRHGKVTGTADFAFRPRPASGDGRRPVTGEGTALRTSVTGDAWRDQPGVTGTEGTTAAGRNPSRSGGEPQAFAGTRRFRPAEKRVAGKSPVTGIESVRELPKATPQGAPVTVSGGGVN